MEVKFDNPELYKIAISQIKDYGIFMLDANGTVVTWNAGAESLKGYRANEIIGKHFSVFYPEHDIKNFKPQYELNVAIQDGRFEDEGWRLRKDGTRFWANVIITPIMINAGLQGFIKVSRDLTQRKMSEDMLREAKDQYELLIDQAKDYAIFMLDPKGRISTWNIGAERIKGYRAEDVIGRHFSMFYPQDAKDSLYPQYELKQAEEHGRYEDEGWRIKKDGSQFWANVVITAIYRENKLIGFSKLTRDITFKKRIREEELKSMQAQELLEQTKLVNEELSRFAHIVAHDLRTPLRAIGGFSQILAQEIKENNLQNVNQHLDRISLNIEKMKHLISGILEYAQVGVRENRKDEIATAPFIRSLTSVINLKHNVQLDIKEPLPVIRFNPELLRQIFDNLISNAVKYNKSEVARIEIGCKELDGFYEFYVRDNGIGIDEKYQNNIFEIFSTLDEKSESSSGIGLSIVKKAIESGGGKVWVKSQPGMGSTFYFTICKEKQAESKS